MEVSMRKIALLAAAGTLAVVPAAGAPAKSGHGPGGKHGKPAGQKLGKGKGRCAKPQRKAFVVGGLFVSFTATADTTDAPDAGDLVVDVKKSNRHARSLSGQQTFVTTGAKVNLVGVTDGDGDGAVTLADARAGDKVKLIGKLVRPKRGCTQAEPTVAIRKVTVKRPGAPEPAEPAQQG
jgi:hypothetical protein